MSYEIVLIVRNLGFIEINSLTLKYKLLMGFLFLPKILFVEILVYIKEYTQVTPLS